MNDLIPMDISPVKLFSEKGLDPILNEIKKKVDSFEADIDSAEGRKEVASFAHKIAKSKTFIEKMGKELVSKQKAAIKLIDMERKRSRDFLDEQRDRARRPLTRWEEAKEKAIAEEAARIEFESDLTEALAENDLFNRQKEIERKEVEFAKQEEEKRQKEETTRIEQERIEREERLKKEAAADAEKKAREAIAAEKEKTIRLEIEAKVEKERAVLEAERKAEEKAAKIEADRVAKEIAQRAKIEAERIVAEKAAENKTHRRKINNEALKGFEKIGHSEREGKLIIEAIAKGLIPHIIITY